MKGDYPVVWWQYKFQGSHHRCIQKSNKRKHLLTTHTHTHTDEILHWQQTGLVRTKSCTYIIQSCYGTVQWPPSFNSEYSTSYKTVNSLHLFDDYRCRRSTATGTGVLRLLVQVFYGYWYRCSTTTGTGVLGLLVQVF